LHIGLAYNLYIQFYKILQKIAYIIYCVNIIDSWFSTASNFLKIIYVQTLRMAEFKVETFVFVTFDINFLLAQTSN